jgi:hypothetical protein
VHLLVGQSFERIRQHQLAQVAVPFQRGDALTDRDELLGHDHNRRLMVFFDDDGVMDTP